VVFLGVAYLIYRAAIRAPDAAASR
jgi:hypothetical protein